MRWCASKRRKEEFSDCVWKSGLTEPYLWCCLGHTEKKAQYIVRSHQGMTTGTNGLQGHKYHKYNSYVTSARALEITRELSYCRDGRTVLHKSNSEKDGVDQFSGKIRTKALVSVTNHTLPKTRIFGLHFCRREYGSSFQRCCLRKAPVWVTSKNDHYTVQDHSRSPVLLPTKSPYATYC